MEDMYNKLQTASSNEEVLTNKELAIKVGRELALNGATNVSVLELTDLANWCDYMVIGTSNSHTQSGSCMRKAAALLAEYGIDAGSAKNARDDVSGWLLLDGGDIVVHLLTEELRQFYNIEGRWATATVLTID